MDLITEAIVKQGYLVKSPPLNKMTMARWCNRWFVLYDPTSFDIMHSVCTKTKTVLYYFENKESFNGGRKPKGQINLEKCQAVTKHEENVQGRNHIIDVRTQERIYLFCAEDDEEMNSWITCLTQYIDGSRFAKETRSSSIGGEELFNKQNKELESYIPDEPNQVQLQLERLKIERDKRRSQESFNMNCVEDFKDSEWYRGNSIECEEFRRRSSSAGNKIKRNDSLAEPTRRHSGPSDRCYGIQSLQSLRDSLEFHGLDGHVQSHRDSDSSRSTGSYTSYQTDGSYGEINTEDDEIGFSGPKLFSSKTLKRDRTKNMINYIEEVTPESQQKEETSIEEKINKIQNRVSLGSKFRVSQYRGERTASFMEDFKSSMEQ